MQFGPGIASLVVELHTEMGVPLAKVAGLLRTRFGLAPAEYGAGTGVAGEERQNSDLPGIKGHHSSASTAARSSVTCTARIGVGPADGDESVQRGAARPAAPYASASAARSSSRCTR